jgi:calcium/calmodulin-dependent 3',5'-cyclic nucleotide phosphodiesterase
LLREEKTNILIALEDDQFKSFRKQLVSNILHTDMSDHFRLVKDFETTLKEKQAIGGTS